MLFHTKHSRTFFASDMVEHNFIKFSDEEKQKKNSFVGNDQLRVQKNVGKLE